jgi:penicillin amidase
MTSVGEMSRRTKILNVLILVCVLSVTVAFVWVMSSLPYVEGHQPLTGLEQPVSVTRDHLGIPRISASSERDAYVALGYVHAQDRIWQMEMQRRAGAGRLAEIIGERGLASDKFMRTLGLYRLAEGSVAQVDKPTRDALEAYADGVNAWIASHRHRLPLEFSVLGFRPEQWTPADSLVWGRLMALQLTGNWQDKLLRARLSGAIDGKWLQELWPAYPPDAPVTLSAATASRLAEILPEAAAPHLASNIWMVAGSHTATGKPLLANDPHLGFRAPILWYLASVEFPGISLSGATVPGVPFHLIGHNGRIAWGSTTTGADTVDLFVEKQVNDTSYRAPGGNRPFLIRDEIIHVKGGADVTLKVRETRHGPVVSDLIAQDIAHEGEVVAMAATALVADDLTGQALYRLNRATDWRGFTNALKDFHAPVQNMGYADTQGNIGFFTAGRVPLRKAGNNSVPLRGWTGDGDWTGWLPFAKLPQSFNPKSGLLINANNKVVPDSYPYRIATDWPNGTRAQRIHDLLNGRNGLGTADMAAMQLDTLSLQALELKELITTIEPKTEGARKALALITAWDGHADRLRPEPLIFAAWMSRLDRAVFADEMKKHYEQWLPVRPTVLAAALTSTRHWCDNITTPEAESCEDMIERSLEQTVEDLTRAYGPDMGKWSWGAAHQAAFIEPVLSQVPVLNRYADLRIATDGDDFTVNRGTYATEAGATHFAHVHGAGLRAVFDLADLGNSRFVIAAGQSGNPLSHHYDDMMEAWRNNQGVTLGIHKGGSAILLLEPTAR